MSDYISREAAIAFIREQSEEMGKAFEELGGESGIYADAYNDLAEDFYRVPAADVEPVRRWIPCSKRMPDMPGDYLVCTKNEYYGTKNVSKRYFNGNCWSGRWTNITHWMPLPEPPEEAPHET